ncbi:hypothetical protein Tco_1575325 [Tanacetum coccineum]
MQWKNPSRIDTKRTNISSRSRCYRSHSMLSLKCTCTSSGIPCTSMTPSTDSRLIRRNDSSLLWKSSDISFRFAQEESSQIYGAVLPECLTSPEMKESKAYKTFLAATADEEPVQKGKRVKRSAKKSSTTPAAGIVFRETPVKTKSTGKEKVDVSRGKAQMAATVAVACCETHGFNSGSSPTVSYLGTSMVRLMVSSVHEAWMRTNEHYLLAFIRVCDVPNQRAKGSLWFIPCHYVTSKGILPRPHIQVPRIPRIILASIHP